VWQVVILFIPVVGIVLTAVLFVGGIVKAIVPHESKAPAPAPVVVSGADGPATPPVAADEQPAPPDSVSKPPAAPEPTAKPSRATAVAIHTPVRKHVRQH
jgi:hypothetical protein